MAVNIDNLVQRQASVLAEIDRLNSRELDFLGNPPLPESAGLSCNSKARKLLRGLVRSRSVGQATLSLSGPINKPGVVPALPGFFVINLVPLSDGRYDRERVLKEPVVAWRIDSANYAVPVLPGVSVSDRWAVLTPEGLVVTDQYTDLFGEAPLTLKDWIKSEIEWLEAPSEDVFPFEYPTCADVFENGGPLAKAFGLMMAGRRDWTGTLQELHETLSKFHDGTFAEMAGRPEDPQAFAAALKELEPKLRRR